MAKSGNPRDNRNRKGRSIPNHNDPDVLLKRQAIGIAAFGTAEEFYDPEEKTAGSDQALEFLDDFDESPVFGPGWEEIEAPTTTPEYPRALAAAYHRGAELLVILFRPPGHYDRKAGVFTPTGTAPYILYEDVTIDMWTDLKSTPSTGSWLKSSGVESHSYYKTSVAGAKAKAASLS